MRIDKVGVGREVGASNAVATHTGGAIILVGTPIGNLGDVSVRALDTLSQADIICCEDTRRTRKLLSHAGITGKRLVALHEHNERERAGEIVGWALQGNSVAVVSDAGMPLLSDPGAFLVDLAYAGNCYVSVVPGPDAATAALVLSGLDARRYCVEGFLPRKGKERQLRLDAIARDSRTTVIFEAPGRVASTLNDLLAICGTNRMVAVARELTKLHEEVWRGDLGSAIDWVAGQALVGEVVIVLGGASTMTDEAEEGQVRKALENLLSTGKGVSAAAAEVAEWMGVPKRKAYSMALEMQRLLEAGG
ncbi:MAG: 16S rRNA (cytidine(1402)-2'-O)-methyltransferase [Actinobacteria bacterium]|nr:16S rRNA (cytidine(1402)-2'-O)-methyltransferase [Actinomycetota bacterium]MCL5445967.1 16S rRNA (cytidine(1402)-2'-O)-methyltransferase [Actinomycetota bacterium]